MAKLILKDRGVQTFQDIRLLSMVNQLPRFVSNIEVIMNGLENKAKIDKLEPIKLPGILDKEKEIMGNAFQDFLLNQHDVHFLIRMTKKYHKSLLGFSNRAFVNEKNNEKQSPAIKQLYLKICSIIEELLQSVVSESKNYLNEKLVASRYYAVLHGESLQLKFIMLEKKMAECHVDQYMSSLLKEFFFGFRSLETMYCSYQDLEYAENLILKLIEAFNTDPQEKWQITIWEQLIKLDFNRLTTLDYTKKVVGLYSRKFTTPVESYKFLILTLKMIRQVSVHSKWHYNIDELYLKAYLEDLILEELNCVEKNNPNLDR